MLITILIFPFLVKGQDSLHHRTPCLHKFLSVVKTNPLSVLWGPIPFTSEFRLLREEVIASNQSLQAGISYLGKSPLVAVSSSNFRSYEIRVDGFRFQVSYRYYLRSISEAGKKPCFAPEGFYMGPHYSYSQARFRHIPFFTVGNINQALNIGHSNLNLIFGWQTLLAERFFLDVFAGAGIKSNRWSITDQDGNTHQYLVNLGDFYSNYFKPTLGFNLGYGFNSTKMTGAR